MPSILISVPREIKERLEKHPEHRYGNCNEFYVSILQRFTESPEFALAMAHREMRWQSAKIAALEKTVEAHKTAERLREVIRSFQKDDTVPKAS